MTKANDTIFPAPMGLNYTSGLTVREYFAAMCLQGMLTHRPTGVLPNFAAMADDAVHQADVLIEALNEKKP